MTAIICDPATKNVLNLSDPEVFSGSFWNYTKSHQQLTLEFKNTERSQEVFQLILVMVRHNNLPKTWQGARIDTTSDQECWNFITKIWNIDEKHDDTSNTRRLLLKYLRLYIFSTLEQQYHVLAAYTIQIEPAKT